MRYDRHMTFQMATGPRGPAWGFVARAGPYTVTAGKAFRERKRLCTLILLRVLEQEIPLGPAHGRAPNDVDLGAYGMWVWIEQDCRTFQHMGWPWLRTRRLDPARVHQPPGRLVAILGPPDAGNEDRGGALNCKCLMARGMA